MKRPQIFQYLHVECLQIFQCLHVAHPQMFQCLRVRVAHCLQTLLVVFTLKRPQMFQCLRVAQRRCQRPGAQTLNYPQMPLPLIALRHPPSTSLTLHQSAQLKKRWTVRTSVYATIQVLQLSVLLEKTHHSIHLRNSMDPVTIRPLRGMGHMGTIMDHLGASVTRTTIQAMPHLLTGVGLLDTPITQSICRMLNTHPPCQDADDGYGPYPMNAYHQGGPPHFFPPQHYPTNPRQGRTPSEHSSKHGHLKDNQENA